MTYMPRVSFAGCDLTECNLGEIYAGTGRKGPEAKDRISFARAKLYGADLRGADLRFADFTECVGFDALSDLGGARLEGADGLTAAMRDVARRKGAIV